MSGPEGANVSPSPDLLAARSAATFGGLRWLSLLGPVVGTGLLVGTHLAAPALFLPAAGAMAAAGLFFYWLIIRRAVAIYRDTERRNRELLSLYRAGLAVAAELSPQSVLQEVVDQARLLIGSRYGALAVYAEPNRIQAFLVSGIPPEHRHHIGTPPIGKGLLGLVLDGQRLRLDNVENHPSFEGLPPGHFAMGSLLAVPVLCQGPNRGSLYLSEKNDGRPFTESEEETLARFASQAAIAIDNAYLHERVRELAAAEERLRIAHEMHDGLAQILAYVNTKALAVSEYLKKHEVERAREQLGQLAEAARQVYADVRGQILDLRTSAAAGELNEALREYAGQWSDQCGVEVELTLGKNLRLEPELELQVLRILQETLANVRKHAAASRVEVELECRDHRLYGRVEDDGRGFNPLELIPASGPRFGLATMRERAAAAGGTLKIDSAPRHGTRVVFDFPVSPHPSRKPLKT